jgi:hypothetical protein
MRIRLIPIITLVVVLVHDTYMPVQVRIDLPLEQEHPGQHQQKSRQEQHIGHLAEDQQGDRRSRERCGAEVRAGPDGSLAAQSKDKEVGVLTL